MTRRGWVVRIAPGRWGSFDQNGRLCRVFQTWHEAYSHAYCYRTGKHLYSAIRQLDRWYASAGRSA